MSNEGKKQLHITCNAKIAWQTTRPRRVEKCRKKTQARMTWEKHPGRNINKTLGGVEQISRYIY